ncbi:MAG TPA: YncE family protein [Methylocella sp.]
MQDNSSKRSVTSRAQGLATLWSVLVLVIAFSARPTEAAPFAYVANHNTVSVIDAATNTVVATVPVGNTPFGVAVTLDGTRVYTANSSQDGSPPTVSVIDTASNTVVATVGVGKLPFGIAVTPDGKHAYVTNYGDDTVSVIDTASNTVTATVGVGSSPFGVAVTPDGTRAYVTNTGGGPIQRPPGTVSVIATATNTVVATIPVGNVPGNLPWGIAITPNGTYAYVTNRQTNGVSVIATATNTVAATVPNAGRWGVAITPDGTRAYVTDDFQNVLVIATATNTVVATIPIPGVAVGPRGVAVTPDGKNVYVANGPSSVSVIATATNAVVATILVGSNPEAVAIGPPSQCIPFSAFSAKLAIDLDQNPNHDAFGLLASFTLGSASDGINPVAEPVTLQIGSFTAAIPPGSFTQSPLGTYTFIGMINGVNMEVVIQRTGGKQFAVEAAALNANLAGTANPVTVRLSIGDDCGTAPVNADIF